MSIKKNIGVLVLLLVLLSMSAVSAEDVSINANDTYQTPNEIQKDFTSLQTDIDNSQGAFELTYDVKHGDDEIDNYGISITKTTIINGNGHTIDANGHGSIFVVKDSSVTLTLNDLTLINANPVSDSSGIVSNGGAVYFDGSTLIVNNVNFKNNMVYKYGGAIYTTGTCIVDSSVFDGNDVQFRSQNIDNGGAAIYADNGASLLISNSQIINNHKNMVIRDNNVGDLVDGVVVATGYTKISKSYFRNNSGCYGGAVTSLGYTNAGKNQIIIENSVFDANRAFQGAAVNVMGSTFKISGTNFTNNKGVGYGSGNPNVGALLTWYGCEGTISDCNFINNTADNGAAYRLGDDNKGVSSASVDSCTFINNTASNQGGAVYEGGKTGKATLDIKNSTFTNNSAKKEGSAIYSGYTLNIDDDTTFTNNMVYMYYTGTLNIGEIKTFTDLQKAINMVEGDIYLSSNVTMLASEADNFVNGIVVDHLVNLKCDGFTINANNLGRIFNVTSTADKLNIYNANLINGNADIGGAIYNTGSVYAYNTNFINNTAATMGGAVFNNGTLTIQKCIVDNNDITKRTSSDSEDYGGAAIYNWYDSTLFIKNSTISNNLKNYKNGDYVVGAVTSLGKTIISQNSYFVNNSGRWGGAITTSGSSLPGKKVNELSISDSTFSKNGGLYGAGIFIQGSKFSITSCVFDSNTASGKGNMTPNDNNGAAIEVTNTDKAITGTISKSTFTNNKAQYGGAIDICAGTIKITNSKFINNSADVEGGAIDINALNGNPKVTISGSKFINNSAPLGGAILNIKDLTVKGSTFINNTPNTIFNWVGAGGNLNLNIRTFTDLQNAIGLVTGTLTLNQNVAMTAKEAADFTNGITINKDITIDGKGHTIDAKNLGRIFSIGEGFTVTLTNATLINGKADKGGAIYNDGSLTLSDVKLSDNAADSYGGAVFNNGHLVVGNSVFDSNDIVNRGSASVDYGGAAIYNWYDGTLTVSGSNFTNNIKNYKNGDNLVGAITTIGNATVSGSNFVNNSGRWGGAISATGAELRKNSSTLTVSNTIFKDNSALYAGAVYIWGSNYNIADCVFDNNTAFGKGNMTPNNNNGGALVVSQVSRFNEPITGTISGSKFTNNKAQYGGAAYFNKGFVTITDSVFENNVATAEGGAVDFSHASVKDLVVSINNSSFVGNKAPVAGAIFTNVDSKITNSNFINNSAAKIGGAICNVNDLTVENSKFVNNTPQAIHNSKELHLGIETFTDLQNAIDLVDGILTLDSDIAMTDDEAAGFVNGVAINKDIVIDGKGHTISAEDLGRIFSIGEGFTVTLTNATLINGKADKGGAIYNDGSLTLSDVKLSDNAADSYGGAVFNNGHLVVGNSVFDSNDIVNRGSASVDYGGAAIYNWYDGVLTVSGSNFTNNIKNYKNGDRLVGAVATIGDATISDSCFVNNAGRWGGAISASGYLIAGDDVNTLTVSGSTFKENGGLYGAGIFVAGSDFTVSDCVFDKNTAFGKGNMTPNNNNGAAIVVTDTGKDITGAITGSNFTNNKAQYGGAIYICEGNIAISDSLFENNSADVEGGAIDIDSAINNPVVTVENSKFVNNTPQAIHNSKELHLGIETFTDLQNAIDLVDGILTLDSDIAMTDDEAANFVNGVIINKNIRIDGKGHTIDAKNLGRIFEIDGGFAVTLTNVTLTNGNATVGGAIYNFGNLDLVYVNFVNNTAKYGGAIMNYAYGLVLDDSTFTNNTAKIGGAIYNSADCFVVGNSTFANNTATSNGGVIFNYGIGFVVGNSTFVNNSAADGAGAIMNGGRGFVVGNSTFANNTATSKGGAIYNYGIGFVVGNSTFANNTAEDAGAVYNEGDNSVVGNSTFANNTAEDAGAVYNKGDNSVVGNSTFVNNTATSIGGAIINNGKLVVDNSAFEDNAANYYGGAIFNWDDLQVTNSAFDGNDILVRNIRAMDNVDHGGAAIYNWKNGKLDISKSNFTNNIKNYKNGDRLVGAVATIGDATISDSYFVNNSGRWGGALSVMGGEFSIATNFIDIDGTKFVNNSALYGGAMFVWGSNYSISNSVFDNNSAFGKGNMTPNNNNGGALVVTQGNIPISGTIINSNFTNNKAQYGGAAWINEGTIDISNSNFINNTVTVEAGAIGFEPAYTKITATVYGTNFINNTAGVDGGAIYSNGDLRISDSDFDNNKAQKADIIYSNINGLLSINGNNYSNYTENKAPIINLAGIETISSDGGVIITVLDNKTVNVCYGDVVTLHAIITVDGVLVANQDLSFSVYNGEDVVVCKANSLLNGSYVATYKINDVINKTVSIVYDGPEVHINTGILNVSKANPDLTVGALNITVGDLEIITVTGPKDATGLITLTLNGIDYILPIYNGEAKFYFQDLAYGTYDVSASYSGDNHYVAAENSTVFKVDKVLANLKINVEDITFGENGLVIITLPSDIDGSIVTVNVNGKVYPVDIENGFGKLPLRELDAGDYTISAVFAGNDKYLPGVSNALLTVSKADPALNVLISDVGYDGVFNINVALTGVDAIGLNGNVIVTVNNKDYSVNIVNGKGTAVGVKLAAGTYDFTAAWAGNDNYNAVGDSGKFSVAKVDSIIDVAVSDIKVGEDAVISVKLLSDATGSVTVTVNGKDYTETVVNGVANVKVTDLKAGTYDVAVKYSGDNNYNAAVATSSFTVSKVDSTMDVTVNDIVFGGDLIVDAVLPVDATGEVVITVNSVDYHVSIENGKATGTISGLAAGDYTVAIKYVGDDKYTGVEVAENVNVAKAQPVLGVVIADVDYGNGFVIEATLTGVNGAPLSGNVIVTVAGKEYTVKVTDGKGIATGDKLAAGTYAFAAVWAGDDNYNIVTENGDFKVNKVDSAIDVAVSDIKVGEDAVISVKLASDATGEVVITVNGEDYTAAIENGVASVTVSDLKAGDYTVAVKYTGDNNYNEATGSAEFSVLKITPEMDVTVEDIVFGEDLIVNAVLPVDATGEVVITVNGVDYHVAIENGVASVTVSGLEAGDYTVAVKYAGDDNYNAAEVTKGVNVAKANPALNVIIDSVDYGNVFTINAVLTGVNNAPLDTNIIVTVNGKNYIVAIVNGKGTFHADKLAAGSYNFNARFAGSNNYNEVSDSGKFNVYKVDSAIGITVKDINVGEDAVITVKLFSDATGELTVTVNGKDYTANVVNGRATVSVSDLKAGNYDVVAKYSGDNNYNAAVATSSFTVSKVDSTMDVTINDIVFGGDLTVDVVLPVDATGEVIITVDGTSYTAGINDGKATQVVKDLTAGSHVVVVKYAGDDKYIGVEVAENVNVAKAQPVLGVVIADVDYGNGFVIEATLTGVNGAPLSGNVIVTVAGKEYTVKVTDGKGIATGDKLAAGTYAFAAVWAGDDNYNIVTENGDFKVNKIDSSVAVNVNNIKVGEELTITVNVPFDATGDVTVSVDGKEYNVAIENGKAVKTIADLKANDYTVTVKYSGDNNYNANQNTTEFTVSKISDYNMNITVPEFKEGVNSTINVVLPKDATGTVTVEIGGKNYTANVTDGVANVIIPGLGVGDYNITTTYSGDAKYDLMTKKGNITVIPNVDVNLDVDDVVMVYHDGTRLVAKLTDYQGKPIVNATIYFNINGVNYARTTDANGTASIALNLESGAYPVIVAYNGSASYSKISKNITVTINPSIIADDLVKMYKNDTKFSAKFLGSDGKVLANTTVKFNINGVLYTKTTNNDGVADLGIMLRPGNYILTAYNPVTGEQQGFNITVKSLIVQNDLTKYYMNASKFQATIYDKNGSLAVNKNVTFNIHGVFYTRTTDENGVVSLGISLRPGEYVITTMYEGLDLGNTVTVLPTLVTHDLNMKYMDGSNFTAQTLDGQGNPLANQNVSFNVNGVFYHKVTDDNGFASLTIRLMSGKYIITSSWNDFQTGNNITIS
nr:Ig-like domain repeat protein [Methanobrevibacter smithii]